MSQPSITPEKQKLFQKLIDIRLNELVDEWWVPYIGGELPIELATKLKTYLYEALIEDDPELAGEVWYSSEEESTVDSVDDDDPEFIDDTATE